jgi:hypothetical protein
MTRRRHHAGATRLHLTSMGRQTNNQTVLFNYNQTVLFNYNQTVLFNYNQTVLFYIYT